jgi:hypothetical protein
MMACASGGRRAIISSVISSDMPFLLGKSRRVAGSIPKKHHSRPWPITFARTHGVVAFTFVSGFALSNSVSIRFP